jgi:translation initiation factor 3 subunit M
LHYPCSYPFVLTRSLTNSYNFFPAESPLRPAVLLTLITLLGAADDLAALPLTPADLTPALNQWSTSEEDKVAFLTQAAGVYEKAGELSRALDLTVLALERAVDAKTAEHALALALALPNRFDVDDILKVQGARDALSGPADELVDLFTKVDELAAVDKAAAWAKTNAAYVEKLGVAGLDADEVLRKVRLVALTTLAARSATKEISYVDLAGALKVDEAEVEAWVIDAIRAGLLQARLSQPQSLVRVISVSSRGTRRFGKDEWQLLEKRLSEWKAAVSEARATIESAEEVAAQGQITNQRRPQQRERRQQGQQEQQQEEAAQA